MEGINLHGRLTELASAIGQDGAEVATLKMIEFPYGDAENWVLNSRYFYVVDHNLMDWDECCWNQVFNDLRSAVECFGKEVNRKWRSGERRYGKVEWTEKWKYYMTELLPDRYYGASSTGGDYGPGNPWDAPGMSEADFI